MSTETTLIILFAIATGVAVTAQRFRVPYTVALVLAGLLFGAFHLIAPPHLTHDLLFAIFLPGLIFEAAFKLDSHDIRSSWRTVGALALPGVMLAIVLAGAVVAWTMGTLGTPFTFTEGLLFGALIAATDPIAVVALFQSLHVPQRLSTLIEGESLLNDGTSIVLLSLVLAAVTGLDTAWGALALRFVVVTGGGALLGIVFGLLTALVLSRINDPMIEITITLIAAYGSFALAEQLGCSGVIATVATGILCGRAARHKAVMSETTLNAVGTFWDYLAFALNSVIFLLIGFTVHLSALRVAWLEIAAAFLIVTLVRAVVVFTTALALSGTSERIPPSWRTVMIWGGLRGALSMVLALALPETIPNRDLLITMTFGVVLLSILLQGLSMPWLLGRLRLGGVSDGVSIATPS